MPLLEVKTVTAPTEVEQITSLPVVLAYFFISHAMRFNLGKTSNRIVPEIIEHSVNASHTTPVKDFTHKL